MALDRFFIDVIRALTRPILKWTEQARQHDKEVFEQLETIFPEDELRQFLNLLEANHSYFVNSRTPMLRFVEAATTIKLSFLSSDFNRDLANYVMALKELSAFLAKHFYTEGPGQGSADLVGYMEPHLNQDRAEDIPSDEQMSRYDKYGVQLAEMTAGVWDSYRHYRKAIQEDIFV